MIPSMIVFGLVLGRWWRVALVSAAVLWVVLLVGTGVMDVGLGLFGAAMLAVANAGAGVLVLQGVLQAYQWLRHRRRRSPHSVVGA